MGSYDRVPSFQAPTAITSRGPGTVSAYPLLKRPRACLTGGSGPVSDQGGRQDGQTGGEILPARAHRRVERVKV
jgi:hypothetical protein